MKSRRVLGIDPGTLKLGWAILERGSQPGTRPKALAAGVIKAPSTWPLPERLAYIFEGLAELAETHRPTELAVESIFYAKFPKAAIQLGHVRGVVLLLAQQQGMSIYEYAPALVKRSITGRGAADKSQVAKIVAAALSLSKVPPSDAADALAIALTHVQATFILPKP